MTIITRPGLTRLFLTATATALALLIGGAATAASACRTLVGKVTIQDASGPGCTSAVGLCATGTFTGGIAGTFAFTGTSIIPTADTPTTSVVFVTGDNTITTSDGTLQVKDAFVLETAADGDVAEVDTIVGGTGRWAGATGTIRAAGNFVNGAGQALYVAQIC